MLLDPTGSPRRLRIRGHPSRRLFYDAPAGAGRLIAHSDWTPNGTMFDYRASWITINHQDGDGGQFEFFRNGEWLTKEMSNYDNNAVGLTTEYHNTLALQNWSANGTPNLNWFEAGEWANGSQWMLGQNAGDPTTVMSSGTGLHVSTRRATWTNLYNWPGHQHAVQRHHDAYHARRPEVRAMAEQRLHRGLRPRDDAFIRPLQAVQP